MIKVTVTLLVPDEGEGGADGMELSYKKNHLDLDDLIGTADSIEVKFEEES